MSFNVKNVNWPATINVKSKPFFTDFLWTWLGSVAKPTYCFSYDTKKECKGWVKCEKKKKKIRNIRLLLYSVSSDSSPDNNCLGAKTVKSKPSFKKRSKTPNDYMWAQRVSKVGVKCMTSRAIRWPQQRAISTAQRIYNCMEKHVHSISLSVWAAVNKKRLRFSN